MDRREKVVLISKLDSVNKKNDFLISMKTLKSTFYALRFTSRNGLLNNKIKEVKWVKYSLKS